MGVRCRGQARLSCVRVFIVQEVLKQVNQNFTAQGLPNIVPVAPQAIATVKKPMPEELQTKAMKNAIKSTDPETQTVSITITLVEKDKKDDVKLDGDADVKKPEVKAA